MSEKVVAENGYHSAEYTELADSQALRTCIHERIQMEKRRWSNNPADVERAFRLTRQRIRWASSRALQHRRSEVVERKFAQSRETGGGRQGCFCGLEKDSKRCRFTPRRETWA
jgi:hypothetical protein